MRLDQDSCAVNDPAKQPQRVETLAAQEQLNAPLTDMMTIYSVSTTNNQHFISAYRPVCGADGSGFPSYRRAEQEADANLQPCARPCLYRRQVGWSGR